MQTTRCKTCKVCVDCGRCQKQMKGMRTITASFHVRELLAENRKKTEKGFIVADIGTTTIAMELYDFQGIKASQYTCLNPQRVFGSDVISRISAAQDKINALQLQKQLRDVLLEGVAYFEKEHTPVDEIYVSGNTTMLYFLWGKDVAPLGVSPFLTDELEMECFDLNGKKVHTLPGISAFVGSDVLSGALALGLHQREKLTLFIDLGTNGEMMLGGKDKILCTSVAAGPAFDHGICEEDAAFGADMVSLVAELLQQEIVDGNGLLTEEYFEKGITIGGVVITQDYLQKLLLAKAAVAAGIEVLGKEYGILDFSEISRIYMAGGMGFTMSEDAAIRIGMFPETFRKKTVAVGNTSLAGAYYFARAKAAKEEAQELKRMARKINLARHPDFSKLYCDKMVFNIWS